MADTTNGPVEVNDGTWECESCDYANEMAAKWKEEGKDVSVIGNIVFVFEEGE